MGSLVGRLTGYIAARVMGTAFLFACQLLASAAFADDANSDGAKAHRLNSEAVHLADQGKNAEAMPLVDEAVKISERVLGPEAEWTGAVLRNAARIHMALGDLSACGMFGRSIAIERKLNGDSSLDVGRLTAELGACRQRFNDAKGAYRAAQEATALFERVAPDSLDLANALRAEGALAVTFGDTAGARAKLERSLEITERLTGPTSLETATVLSRLGQNRLAMNDLEGAAGDFLRATNILIAVYGKGHPEVAEALGDVARVLAASGQVDKAANIAGGALDTLFAARGRDDPEVLRLGIDYAAMEIMLGKLDRADKIIAVVLGSKTAPRCSQIRSAALMHRARVARLKGELPRALEEARAAVAEFRACDNDPVEGETLEMLVALMELANGHTAAGVLLLAKSEDALEQVVRQILLTGSEEERRRFLSLYGRDQRIMIGLHMSVAPRDRGMGRLAMLSLLRRKGLLLDGTTDAIRALRRQLSSQDALAFDQLAALRSQLAVAARGGGGNQVALHAASDALEAKLMARSAPLRAQSAPITLERLQAVIPEDAALVELAVYTPGDDLGPKAGATPRYVAYALRKTGDPAWVDLGDANATDRMVTVMRQALSKPDSDPHASARALDAAVMAPIRKLLGNTRRILIAPDGALNLVPFGALVDENGKYLVEHTTFVYLASGRELLNMNHPPGHPGAPFILANPEFGTGQANGKTRLRLKLSPLPGSEAEARAIAGLLKDAVVVTGARATKQSLLAVHGPRIVHLATHGIYLDLEQSRDLAKARALTIEAADDATVQSLSTGDPLVRSLLAFAGASAGSDDSLLTALEAANLDLWGTKLVVLSACETGVGEVRAGDGVYGLRRAFAAAGAESLVMSLWSVDDEATRELMVGYYTELGRGATRGEALRSAQRAVAHKSAWSHPFYWAAFIASGDWRNLDGKDAPTADSAHADGDFAKARGCRCEAVGGSRSLGGGAAALMAVAAGLARRARRASASAPRR